MINDGQRQNEMYECQNPEDIALELHYLTQAVVLGEMSFQEWRVRTLARADAVLAHKKKGVQEHDTRAA